MQDKQIIGKIVSGISTPMSLLLLVFFFLPWLNLTCGGQEFGKASGFQLAQGKMTAGDFAKNPGKMMGATTKPAQADEKESEKKLNETIKTRPWCYLGLIIPVILLVAGLSGLKGGASVAGKSGVLLLVLGAVGVIVMIMAANVEYANDFIEHDKKEKAAKAATTDEPDMMGMADAMQKQMEEQMQKAFETRPTGILWGSLVLYILVILCGLVNMLVSRMSPRIATATPVGPAPPPQAE